LKKKSKTPRAKLIAEMDKLWRQVAWDRARGICEWCGKPAKDVHHMVARRRSSYLRHRLENAVAVCASCHFNFHNKESLTGWRIMEFDRADDYEFLLDNMHKNIQVRDYEEVRRHLE
jgi:5-methylcytosine-specific restriction endonuclease McrA